MRRALALALVALTLAGSAGAQQVAPPSKSRIKVPPPAAQGLKGPVAPPAAPAPPAPAPPPSLLDTSNTRNLYLPPTVAGSPVGGGAQRCRTTCAQAYYFCLAGDHPDDCSQSWGQCRAGCGGSSLGIND